MKRIAFLCVIIAFDALSVDAAKFRCDYTFNGTGWFKYHELPKTWEQARDTCRFEGGILASPTTDLIKSVMTTTFKEAQQQNKIRRDGFMFTGIHSMSARRYYSVDGVSLEAIPHNWNGKKPDNDVESESCIIMNENGELADVGCNKTHPYMCYRAYSDSYVGVCGTPDPEYRYERRTSKCYKFHTTPRSFEEARFACSAEGGHLAIVNSDEESIVLKDIFQQYPDNKLSGSYRNVAFIGFQKWGNKKGEDFMTIEGQTLQEAGFPRFSSGQPDNAYGNEHCGSIFRNGLLNDQFCDPLIPFICEKSPNSPPVCDSH